MGKTLLKYSLIALALSFHAHAEQGDKLHETARELTDGDGKTAREKFESIAGFTAEGAITVDPYGRELDAEQEKKAFALIDQLIKEKKVRYICIDADNKAGIYPLKDKGAEGQDVYDSKHFDPAAKKGQRRLKICGLVPVRDLKLDLVNPKQGAVGTNFIGNIATLPFDASIAKERFTNKDGFLPGQMVYAGKRMALDNAEALKVVLKGEKATTDYHSADYGKSDFASVAVNKDFGVYSKFFETASNAGNYYQDAIATTEILRGPDESTDGYHSGQWRNRQDSPSLAGFGGVEAKEIPFVSYDVGQHRPLSVNKGTKDDVIVPLFGSNGRGRAVSGGGVFVVPAKRMNEAKPEDRFLTIITDPTRTGADAIDMIVTYSVEDVE